MDLDAMLKDLGQFGWYQVYYFTLLLFPVLLSGFRGTEYVFTTMNIPHRCRVPECEGISGPAQFSPEWLSYAVPLNRDNTPQACLRYRPQEDNSTAANSTTCPAQLFSSYTQTCDTWVFSEPARSMARDFQILCPQDYWKLTTIGSVSVATSFIGLPLTGLLSDRLGRKTVLVFASVAISVSGVIRSLIPSYYMMIAMEVFDGIVSGAIYSPAFLLGLETLSPSKRLLGSMFINTYFTLGEMVLALIMWAVQDWRIMERVFYIPMCALIALHWLLPESVRWLHTKGRYDEVANVFKKIAKVNKTEDQLPNILKNLQVPESTDKDLTGKGQVEESKKNLRFGAVLKSRVIMWRLGVCSLCWVACIFTYYGISQNVAYLKGGNRYVSYLLISVVELPAYVASLWLPGPPLGRRGSTVWSFFLAGAACFANIFFTADNFWMSITLFLVSKFCSTLTVCVIYIYTAEIFPTELRQSLLSACSMVGRIGSILSQQTPLIGMYMNPMLLFGTMSVLGGALALTCPETLHTTLPDTIEEAENIGKSSKHQESQL